MLVLIETLWNVKGKTVLPLVCKATRINRNIVECKVEKTDFFTAPASTVLIETLWNVKFGVSGSASAFRSVLIETLWNVKILSSALKLHQ